MANRLPVRQNRRHENAETAAVRNAPRAILWEVHRPDVSRSCEESNINVMIIGVLDRIATLLAGGFCVLLYRVLHGRQSEAVRPEATVANGSPG